MKLNDDFGNGLMMLFVDNLPASGAQALTVEEKRLAQLPGELQPAVVMAQIGQASFVENYMAQQHALNQIRIKEEKLAAEEHKRLGRFLPQVAHHRRHRGGR